MMPLDDIEKRLLSLIQKDFPLVREPFSALGRELGIGADAVINLMSRLRAEGVIRYIGPIFDPRKLGYRSTLAAMQLPPERLDAAARLVSQHPRVSHNYARNHRFNLWFTLSVPASDDLEGQLQELGHLAGAEAALNLPALRVFKIRAYFDLLGEAEAVAGGNGDSAIPGEASLSPAERAIINELQQDLPLAVRPFDSMAERLGTGVGELLEICRSLQQRGIMRRFSAAVKHDRVGFVANAMACWMAPAPVVERAGRRLAALPEVSHCYERQTGPLWPYNLFAMIHGRSPEACQLIAEQISQESGLDNYQLLFSTKEYKKVRVRYAV